MVEEEQTPADQVLETELGIYAKEEEQKAEALRN